MNPDSGIALFTDGSSYYKDKSGGWAWVALDAYEGLYMESGACSDATNNQMELKAVSEGLQRLFALYGSCNVLVYSDSEYVVKGLNNGHKRNKNVDYWKEVDVGIGLHEMGYKVVQFEHVKGHADNIYNEMADNAAGKARKESVSDN